MDLNTDKNYLHQYNENFLKLKTPTIAQYDGVHYLWNMSRIDVVNFPIYRLASGG